jgi:hypothetical protein
MSKEARGTWFRGYIEENREFPQMTAGLGAAGLAAVVEDPPRSWSDYMNSGLSRDQLRTYGEVLSRFHHDHGIAVATRELAQPGDRIIADDFLQTFWRNVARNNTHSVLNYLTFIDLNITDFAFNIKDPDSDKRLRTRERELDELLNKRQREFGFLRRVTSNLRQTSRSGGVRRLSDEYIRELAKDPKVAGVRSRYSLQYVDLIHQSLRREIPEMKRFDWLTTPWTTQ